MSSDVDTPQQQIQQIKDEIIEKVEQEIEKIRNVIKTHRDLDMSSEEEEEEEEYKKGGYHPVKLGDFFNNKYTIKAKLGWGHFSTVWLGYDNVESRQVALKVVKSAHHYTDAARDEIKILSKATSSDPHNTSCVIRLLDHFEIAGPNGQHVSMVFEKVGCNLLTLIRMYKYKGLPIPLVRMITKQLVIGVEFLHRCLIIHTDLKPENLLMVKTPKIIRQKKEEDKENAVKNRRADGLPWTNRELIETFGNFYKIKIVDLGNACWTYKHFTDDVQTRQYRAPEVILGAKYDTAIDIWSIACIVFELLTGDLLFEPKTGRLFDKNDDHIAQIQELLGRMPLHVAMSGKRSQKIFNSKGELRYIKNLKFWPLKDVLREKYKFSEKDSEEISDFMIPMLNVCPADRATARQCLQHPWIKNVDVKNFATAFL